MEHCVASVTWCLRSRFERRLSERVFSIIQEHWHNKPVLTFCSSRRGTVECANQVKQASMRTKGRMPSFFVRSEDQRARLKEAVKSTQDKPLAEMLGYGIAWHNASMETSDRMLVEQLFISRDVMFLACTATLAQVSFGFMTQALCQGGYGYIFVCSSVQRIQTSFCSPIFNSLRSL